MPNQKKDTPMQITVRLYRQHDMDLVGLYRCLLYTSDAADE